MIFVNGFFVSGSYLTQRSNSARKIIKKLAPGAHWTCGNLGGDLLKHVQSAAHYRQHSQHLFSLSPEVRDVQSRLEKLTGFFLGGWVESMAAIDDYWYQK